MELLNLPPASDVVRLSRYRVEVPLLGTKNHVNLAFTAPDKFLPTTLSVYFNGQRMRRGIGEDYVVSESGGPGTGYDTITLLDAALAPYSTEQLFADYIQA
jgi:hypothetical protein